MRTRKNCISCGFLYNDSDVCPHCGQFIFRRIFKSSDGNWYQLFKGQKLLLNEVGS